MAAGLVKLKAGGVPLPTGRAPLTTKPTSREVVKKTAAMKSGRRVLIVL